MSSSVTLGDSNIIKNIVGSEIEKKKKLELSRGDLRKIRLGRVEARFFKKRKEP